GEGPCQEGRGEEVRGEEDPGQEGRGEEIRDEEGPRQEGRGEEDNSQEEPRLHRGLNESRVRDANRPSQRLKVVSSNAPGIMRSPRTQVGVEDPPASRAAQCESRRYGSIAPLSTAALM